MREVEPGTLRIDERSLLRDMIAQHHAQRRVHQVRRRMVPGGARPRVPVDLGGDGVAALELAGLDLTVVAEHLRLDLLRVVHGKERQACAALGQLAAVADLAPGLRIERRTIQNDHTALAGRQRIDRTAVAIERDHARILGERVVTVESRLPAAILEALGHLERGGGAGALALFVHRRLERRLIDAHPAFATDIRRQVERKPEGVVERERGLAG